SDESVRGATQCTTLRQAGLHESRLSAGVEPSTERLGGGLGGCTRKKEGRRRQAGSCNALPRNGGGTSRAKRRPGGSRKRADQQFRYYHHHHPIQPKSVAELAQFQHRTSGDR